MTAPPRVGGLTFTRRIGAGGEADIYDVAERPGAVCKHYRQPSTERAEKLRLMVEHPPEGTRAGGHVTIAWPQELVLADDASVVGFLMPRIETTAAVPVFQVYNPATRARVAPGFTWRYLLRTARNVAAIVDAVHRAGHVIGDLNESNLLVDRRALVALVDCDSMQVVDRASGRVYRSHVGKPEFLAPELQGRDLSRTDRTEQSDAFALAVMIHQLLLEGVHPHAGVWRGRGEPPDIATRIRKGWVAGGRGWTPVDRAPHALAARVLPVDVRRLLRRGLHRRGAKRPAAWEWIAVLDALDGALRTCTRSPHHVFASRRCPWCARIDRGLPDPFPGPSGRSTLPRRPPPLVVRAATVSGALLGTVPSALARARVAGVAAAFATAGWVWPAVAPVAAGLVVVPLAYALVTPSRHVASTWITSAQSLAVNLGLAFGAASAVLEWPLSLRAASAVATVVQGVLVPASLPAWERARGRLARIPAPAVWALSAAAVVATTTTGGTSVFP